MAGKLIPTVPIKNVYGADTRSVGGAPKQGLDGEVIKGRLILAGKGGKGARQKGGHIDTELIPSPPNRWRLEP